MSILLICLVAFVQTQETDSSANLVRGSVSTVEGQPVEGAKVALAWQAPGTWETTTVFTRADSLGHFEFQLEPDHVGNWSLFAYRAGFGVAAYRGQSVMRSGQEIKPRLQSRFVRIRVVCVPVVPGEFVVNHRQTPNEHAKTRQCQHQRSRRDATRKTSRFL